VQERTAVDGAQNREQANTKHTKKRRGESRGKFREKKRTKKKNAFRSPPQSRLQSEKGKKICEVITRLMLTTAFKYKNRE
jgi:hypothetical protein